MKMILNILPILLFLFINIENGEGMCAFTCSKQNRTYINEPKRTATMIYSHENPNMVIRKGTKDNETIYQFCHERNGPFTVLMKDNGTHDVYRCVKDTVYRIPPEVIITYVTEWVYFESPPQICDVCLGYNFLSPVVLRDVEIGKCNYESYPCILVRKSMDVNEHQRLSNFTLRHKYCDFAVGCNVPRFCPADKDKGQEECDGCEPSQAFDDGLCCEKCKEVKENTHSYNALYVDYDETK